MTFRTGALISRMVIAGPVKIKLFAETDAQDTDIVVKLIDYNPSTGKNWLVASSVVRLDWYLRTYTIWPGVTPGQVYEVDLEIGHRAHVFEDGHSIGIDIQGSDYPAYAVNPGNGDDFYDTTNGVVQNNTIHLGTGNLSQLILPVFDPSV